MKINKSLAVTIALLGSFTFTKAQLSEECTIMLQLYAENAKARNYNEAYNQLAPLVAKCPDASAAIYQYGAIIYQERLDNNVGEQEENVHGLIDMIQAQIDKYPAKVDVTRKKMEIARTMYKYKMGSGTEQFNMFNDIFNTDKDNFTDPNGIITYFSLAKAEFDTGTMDLKGLFTVYDALSEKINKELDTRSGEVDTLGDKLDLGTITDLEKQTLENQKINLSNYVIVAGSLTATVGKLVGCDYLVPLYESEFEVNKNDMVWLASVLYRLNYKDCTDAPIYLKAVKALHILKPSADTAYGLGVIAKSSAEKFKYWEEALSLGVNKNREAKIHYEKGNSFKSSGSYGQAKAEYLAAVRARPSYGIAYLKIANMMAASAQSCGSDPFTQRAVYWVAARWAEKAASISIDESTRSNANSYVANYRAMAPSKQDIFSSSTYNSGGSIKIGCWIGETVTIP
jgi:tetratricopeptide (TPR) repeat protein